MAWHYHDDDLPGSPAEIELTLNGLSLRSAHAQVHHFRIDEEHSNAFAAWKRMGSPQHPDARKYRQLEKASQLAEINGSHAVPVKGSTVTIRFSLPRQAVSLLVFELD
jgi:xylan 1,4-beta-xylosidase